ncbi:hypothetical protein O5D80_004231 [Batrachochytrium dendrobatidis]|nr:hypothetical protein O5D80_004231 [Batrachochytrium dendrobatidis]
MPFINKKGAIVKSQPILFQLYGFFRNLVNVVYLFFVSLLWVSLLLSMFISECRPW